MKDQMMKTIFKSALAGIILFSSTLLPKTLVAHDNKATARKSTGSIKKSSFRKAKTKSAKTYATANSFAVNANFKRIQYTKYWNSMKRDFPRKHSIMPGKAIGSFRKKGFCSVRMCYRSAILASLRAANACIL